MKMKMVGLGFACSLFVYGCAVTSPIVPAENSASSFSDAVYKGEEVVIAATPPGVIEYRAYHQGATGFVSVQSVRLSVEKQAKDYCAEQNKKMMRLREHHSVPPHITGNFPRVELVFGCVS